MKLGFRKGEKGFTLVELMVVMAILGVLSSIVIPSIAGTKQLSTDTQVKQDASSVETAVHQYSAETEGAESLTTDTTRAKILGESFAAPIVAITSSNWPEVALTTKYGAEFPEEKGISDNVSGVYILKLDGTELYSTNSTTLANFAEYFNAINITTLVSGGYLEENPTQYDAVFSSDASDNQPYHNYMWVLKKLQAGTDPKAGRAVQVYKLTKIEVQATGPDVLTYQRLF